MTSQSILVVLCSIIVLLCALCLSLYLSPRCECAADRLAPMEPRTGNLPFVEPLYANEFNLKRRLLVNEDPQTEQEVELVTQQMEDWSAFVDERGQSERWKVHLDRTTPKAFQHVADPIDCLNATQVQVGNARHWTPDKRLAAVHLLNECGFVALRQFYPPALLQRVLAAFDAFRQNEAESAPFRYPCQGQGRVEYMLPFAPPFNTSMVYQDARLLQLLFEFFVGRFKMELQTIITSTAGSGDQRWHQGFPFLFHPEERTPPYAIVVGVPLVNVTHEMGPTEFCARSKLGFTCPNAAVKLPTTLGDIVLFDYKTLHRGPANPTPQARPMMSLVFSKLFFLNMEPIVNRGVSLLQTVHQRRYWEQFYSHPDNSGDFFKV